MLGLSHSNENGQEYGDSTGYMSFGHMQVDWPRKCFNGFENWQLGWYESRQITVNESSLGAGNLIPLASFVDFTRTDYNESVVVNIADKFYLQYNTAKGFNIGTEEKKNKVTVTAPDKGESENLSGLNETNLYEYPNFQNSSHSLVIEACKKGTNHLGADVMLMSIALDKSLCSSVDAEDWARAYNPLGTPADASPKIPTLDSTSKLNPAVGSFFWLLFTKIYSNKPT